MAAAKATQIASLIDLPNDVVLNLGAFVSPVEISNIVTAATFRAQQPNARESSEGAPRFQFGNTQWPRVIRLLLAGRVDGVVLPPRLKDILYNGIETLFKEEGRNTVLSQSPESLKNFCKCTFALLLQYSKLAVDLTLSIRSPIDDNTDEAGNRMLWPMGCGSASSDRGGYNWPIFVFSAPHWHPKLMTLGKEWMLDHDPHNAMILNGTFIRPEHLQDKFIPDKNMGVLTWHRNDEDLFERDIKYGGTGSENNYNLYVTYQMFSTFSSGKHILLWTTQRVLEAENTPFLEVIAQKMKESNVSWLQEAILTPGPSPKHSVCFWVETEGREEQRPRPFRSRGQRLEPPSANKGLEDDPNDFSDEEILQEIRGLVDRLCVVPPLDTDISRFVGSWKLLEAFDAESNALFPVPQGTFIMKLAEVPGVSHQLHFSIRVGNSMGSSMTFLSTDKTHDEAAKTSANPLSIHIGDLMSTMMYCPSLDDLEEFLKQKLPKMTSVELFAANQNAGETLQLNGSPGSFTFLKMVGNVEPIGT